MRRALLPTLLLVAGVSASVVLVAAWPRPGDGYDRHRHGFIEADPPVEVAETTRWAALQTCVDSLDNCRDVLTQVRARFQACQQLCPPYTTEP